MSSATANTARMIAKLLAERPTSQQEIAELIDTVHRTLAKLDNPQRADEAASTADTHEAAAEPVRASEAAETTPKRRGRKPRAVAPVEVAPVVEKPAPPPAPTLVRRAEVQAPIEKANITRLFKGQEVEAELGGTPDAPQLLGFRLLAAGTATHVNSGMVRARQQKPVMVELKREALKRAAARDAAEALLPDRRD